MKTSKPISKYVGLYYYYVLLFIRPISQKLKYSNHHYNNIIWTLLFDYYRQGLDNVFQSQIKVFIK